MAARTKIVKFFVTDEEYGELVRQAGDVPLSAFCRARVFEKITVPKLTVEVVRAMKAQLTAPAALPATQKVCKHGIRWPHCSQCPKDEDYD